MEWTDFLAEIADTHCLSSEQREAFLNRLDEDNRGESEAKLASILNISAYAFKKRMSGVYEQLAQSCPELAASENRGKLEKLRAYLRTKYSERSNKPLAHPELNDVRDIQLIHESINWREICGKVLAQQREKQNFRRAITGRHLGHEAKNVYVKLGLVKPKEQPSRGDEFQPSANQGTLQYQLTEKEIEQEYQYEEFLQQVIAGKEKNFTIVGEPGAGKSTWLEQIALYVDNSNKGFPICISLASLGGKTLEEYLFQIWLKNALLISQCDVGITSAQKKLEELFKSGKVWLLLDGVDEMRADESPLQAIGTQLEGWGDLARVVLTCRSNVWEANPNALLNFETYRTLHFDDEQVGDFIQQWFTQEGKPKLGEQLETKLEESRNDRIRDLIRNPLRLAMLCGIWYFHQGDLPKTKATLYQQYIEYFYRWKQHPQLSDDLDKQEELHTAFSKLALEAIDKKLPLRRKFAHRKMGKSLFQLARDVGWLNWVYKDAETGEDVYAFFHLTFQEYFAACAIDDWHFFLNHIPHNPMQGNYRIFEPQWKDVILLWLGRMDVESEQKEQFIRALVEFNDGCNNFYWYRAYFLAATGIAEYEDCNLSDQIVAQVLSWGFSYFEPIEVRETARTVLKESKRTIVISKLINLLEHDPDNYLRQEVALILGQIDPKNQTAIDVLLDLINPIQNNYIRLKAADSLYQLGFKNRKILNALIDVLRQTQYVIVPYQTPLDSLQIDVVKIDDHNCQDTSICYQAAYNLIKIDPDNQEAFNVLQAFLSFGEAQSIRLQGAGALKTTTPENQKFSSRVSQKEIDLLTRILHYEQEPIKLHPSIDVLQLRKEQEHIKVNAAINLLQIDTSNSQALNVLVNQLHTGQSLLYRLVAAQFLLEEIDPRNQKAFEVLIDGVRLGDGVAANSLIQVIQGSFLSVVVSSLNNYLEYQVYENNLDLYQNCYKVIWHCAQNLPYPDFYRAWH